MLIPGVLALSGHHMSIGSRPFAETVLKTTEEKADTSKIAFNAAEIFALPASAGDRERLSVTSLVSVPAARFSSQWWVENAGKPMLNTAIIEPHNAVTSTVSGISRSLGGPTLLQDQELCKFKPGAIASPEWVAQNLSSGLAAVVPYAIAGLLTRKVLVGVGSNFQAESMVGRFCNNKSTAMILGATIYDGLRKPGEEQSRLGNALGATAGFSFFEYANHKTAKLNGWGFIGSRILIGSVGAMSQHTISHTIATGHAPKGEQLLNAAVSGGMMNLVLPKVSDLLSDASKPRAVETVATSESGLTLLATKDGALAIKTRDGRIVAVERPTGTTVNTPDKVVSTARTTPVEAGQRTSPLDVRRPLAATEGTHLSGDKSPLPPLASLSPRLKVPVPDSIEVRTPRAEWIADPQKVSFDKTDAPARSYETDLGVKIVVEENYAKILDQVREYRRACEQNPHADPYQLAKEMLGDKADYATRALPEDFIPSLEQQPNTGTIRRVLLVDWANPEDPVNRTLFRDPRFCSTVVAEPNGDVTFFQRSRDGYLGFDTAHEFGHVWWYQLKDSPLHQHQVLPYLFELAFSIEPELAARGRKRGGAVDEAWSISLEDVLGADQAAFEAVLRTQPVKCVVMGRALAETLRLAEQNGQKSTNHERWVERARQMEAQLPKAQAELQRIAGEQGNPLAGKAGTLLAFIGDPQTLATSSGIAKIDLSTMFANDETLARVAGLGTLAELNLSGASLTALGLRQFGRMKGLTSLDLSRTPITDSSLAYLIGLSKLQTLNVSNTRVTPSGLMELAAIPSLKELRVAGIPIADPMQLGRSLPGVKILADK